MRQGPWGQLKQPQGQKEIRGGERKGPLMVVPKRTWGESPWSGLEAGNVGRLSYRKLDETL